MKKKPNIVFVLTDDQGYPPLGCHGHPFIKTPTLDNFSNEAINFSQFHSGTTCAPTRAGLMTGHYCNSTGVWHTIGGRSLLRKDEWSLADALTKQGYVTGMFGKWHLGDDYPYRPQDRGFKKVICHGGGGISQQADWWGNDYFDDVYFEDGIPKSFIGYCTDVFFKEGIKFIEKNKSKPFFCYISTNAPHSPFNVEKKYRDLYNDKTKSENYARFLGIITNIDDNFKILRQTLYDLKLNQNTILIFMSDNGQTDGQGFGNIYNSCMKGLKGSEYEGGHRVPFMIYYPDEEIFGGKQIDELTAYVDFMPTLLELCQIDAPRDHKFHGSSLIGLIKNKDNHFWNERIIITDTQRVSVPIKWKNSCVMKNTWRLVNRYELYDLNNDPSQKINVYDQNKELVHELQSAYLEWWEICSSQITNDVPISIGSEIQKKNVLRTHDMRNENSDVVWNQKQIRTGEKCLGYWEVYIENAGEYEFNLRRWPEESDHFIKEGIEGDDVEFRKEDIAPGTEDWYSGGKKLLFDTASLTIGNKKPLYVDINDKDKMSTFKQTLENGYIHISGYFYSSKQNIFMAPYYIYINRLG